MQKWMSLFEDYRQSPVGTLFQIENVTQKRL